MTNSPEEGELEDKRPHRHTNNRSPAQGHHHRDNRRRRSRSRSRGRRPRHRSRSRSRDRHRSRQHDSYHQRRRSPPYSSSPPPRPPPSESPPPPPLPQDDEILLQEEREEDVAAFQAKVEEALLREQEEEDEEQLIAERRRRRQEILAKHNTQQDNGNDNEEIIEKQQPMELDLRKEKAQQQQQVGMDTDGMEESQVASGIGEARNGEELSKRLHATGHHQIEEEGINIHNNKDEDEEEEDIFAATPEDAKHNKAAAQVGVVVGQKRGLVDNYDDAEGYYNFQVGEILADRYEVFATHGRGVFSSVLRARDLGVMGDGDGTKEKKKVGPTTSSSSEVAIKVIRANETMYKAGQVEKIILNKLSEADPDGKRHVIRMLSSFEYRNHLCLVFESMDMNLRELTKRYGRGIGLSIGAVRVYANQLLVALHHLQSCGVIHADIKPDNILVNESRTNVKICDFGSAMFAGDNAITPYLVSRFYRAPEIILGLQYDYPLDMWSIGCVVYELLTGKILFPGRTNNEMLKYMMDVKGPFPKKMIRRAEFAFKHFEGGGGGGGGMANICFALIEEDKISKQPVRRVIANPVVKKDFMGLLAGQAPDRKKLGQLADLLERMMVLDPDKRITPREALRHPFIIES